jgi:type I restriction enzyme S subunit
MRDVDNLTPLREVVELIMGQAPPSKDTNLESQGVPFVRAGEFGLLRPLIREWTTNPLRMARTSDVLLCVVGATCGKINLGEDCAIGRSVAAIRPNSAKLDQYYLYFFMMTLVDRLRSGSVGAAQTVISKEMVESVNIPLLPLPEQRRIVALLDEAFVGLATAKANAERNLQNARAIFESHLQSVFCQRGEGWVEKRLAELSDFKNGLNFTRQSNGQTLRMVGVGDFQANSVVPVKSLQAVTIDGVISEDYLIRQGDILAVRSNGSKDLVGRCMLVPDVDEASSFSGFIIRIRMKTGDVDPRFLLHFMRSRATRERLAGDGGGASISNINQAKLSELPVSYPPLCLQEKIVSRLDVLSEEAQRLARLYERKLAALEELKKSLLHRAFNGEL